VPRRDPAILEHCPGLVRLPLLRHPPRETIQASLASRDQAGAVRDVARAIAVFPVDLLDPDKLDEVLIFLASLPIDPEDRKQLLMEWCRLMGAAITRDMVERAKAE